MKHSTGLGAGTLAAYLLGSTAVYAEVTAADVWKSLTDYYSDLGQTVTAGSTEMQGDTLVITDAVFASEMPEGSFSATLAEMRMKELGDGRVEVTMSGEIPISVKTNPSTGEKVDMGMKFTQSDLVMVVSGETDDMTYDFTAPQMGIEMDGMTVDGAEVPMKLDAAMSGNSGSYRMVTDGARTVTSVVKSDKIDFDISAQDPEGKGNFNANGSLTGLSGTSSAILPEGIDMNNMNASLQAGMSMDGEFSYTGGGYVFDFKEGEDSMNIQSTGTGGTLHFAMSKDGLSYGGEGREAQVAMQMSAFPVPMDMSVAQTAFNLKLPVSKNEAAQPFGLLLKFVDLEISEGLWSMFDPGSQLPRDPATLIVDVSGAAKMLVNIFDPAEAETIAEAPPGELDALDINEIKLSAVGAELTGSGAMTFNNSGAIPQPIGAIDMMLVGGNALIDKLVAMGFVPQDQAMGAKMMMGLFAVPTGEDTLTSKIEFKEDGGIYANGQRIQ